MYITGLLGRRPLFGSPPLATNSQWIHTTIHFLKSKYWYLKNKELLGLIHQNPALNLLCEHWFPLHHIKQEVWGYQRQTDMRQHVWQIVCAWVWIMLHPLYYCLKRKCPIIISPYNFLLISCTKSWLEEEMKDLWHVLINVSCLWIENIIDGNIKIVFLAYL